MSLLFGEGVSWRAGPARQNYLQNRHSVAAMLQDKVADEDDKRDVRAQHHEV